MKTIVFNHRQINLEKDGFVFGFWTQPTFVNSTDKTFEVQTVLEFESYSNVPRVGKLTLGRLCCKVPTHLFGKTLQKIKLSPSYLVDVYFEH